MMRVDSENAFPIEWLLFDWGNVLCEFQSQGFPKLADALNGELDAVAGFVTESGLLHGLMTGAVSPERGLAQLADRFGTLLSRQQAAACFRDDVARELPGIHALLQSLKSRFRLAVLSNTFFGHWDYFETTALYRMFEQPLASHMLGAAKPDPSAYVLALERLGARPGAVLFIDDKLENVQAAQALGIHAVQSQSVDATRAALADWVGL